MPDIDKNGPEAGHDPANTGNPEANQPTSPKDHAAQSRDEDGAGNTPKPRRISQDEAQNIPQDPDPDDPASP